MAGIVACMWMVRGTELSQEVAKVILTDEDALKGYRKLRQYFGDDGNTMVATVEGDIFSYPLFAELYDLTDSLRRIEGVNGVISVADLYDITRDDSTESFRLQRIVSRRPASEAEVDSLEAKIRSLAFYDGLLMNDSTGTALIAISLDPAVLDTERKIDLVNSVRNPLLAFGERHSFETHMAGLPILRVNMHETVRKELVMFLLLALAVTAVTLLLFFRSFQMVIFPMLIVVAVIICTLGFIGLFNYKISLITGIIPALVTVICVPNCVYLITKYHTEYRRTGNKRQSLILMLQRIGLAAVMTNATTAAGIGTMAISDIAPLRELGIVGGLSVVAAFFMSILLIPTIFSFLPAPTPSQTRHLDRRSLGFVIRMIEQAFTHHRKLIYAVCAAIAVISAYGMTKIQAVSFMADDVPAESKVLKDLRYIEARFNGAFPFEILVDTGKRRGVIRRRTLQDIAALQDSLREYPEFSRSLSVADFAKAARQAIFGGGRDAYDLPSRDEMNLIGLYAQNTNIFNKNTISKSLADTNLQIARISTSVRDIGSVEMRRLVDSVQADVDAVFGSDSTVTTDVTGTTPIFIQANKTLIDNLIQSLILAFIAIALMMGFMFRRPRLIIISLIPNILPLLAVAGIMGYFSIPLKPSTALVFGVALGIAVDTTIHLLNRYRMSKRLGETVAQGVGNSLRDTGVGIIYTSLILFFGFVSFTLSDFGGTKALGLLLSLILIVAMLSNLFFLPSLLLSFDEDPAESMTKITSKPGHPKEHNIS
ncbi:MAG: MMPL family transporter [Bacteroidia bacterium]|nr:MMPL family transporter [Bacteroidia bacterium]